MASLRIPGRLQPIRSPAPKKLRRPRAARIGSQFLVMCRATAGAVLAQGHPLKADPPITCTQCEAWNGLQAPFRVYGDTYYVGVAGLSSILIASRQGLILLDGALPQSAPLIAANIAELGFRVSDVRLIVNTHAHFDHAGGIAALQRASGATVASSPAGARALETGRPVPEDPQFEFKDNGFPAVRPVRVVADGETLQVGNLAITAHFTPGHTPGSTSWTWRSCQSGRCLNMVYADSLTAVAAPGFRFTGDARHASTVAGFTRSIAVIEDLPCDVLLTPHPEAFDMAAKLARQRRQPDINPFVQSQACREYGALARRNLQRRIDEEDGVPSGTP